MSIRRPLSSRAFTAHGNATAPLCTTPQRSFGWHYLSNATCLMRPRLYIYVFFVVSRITIGCYIFAKFEENLL